MSHADISSWEVAGEMGEEIGWVFLRDLSQYDMSQGVIDSIVIPKRIMQQLEVKPKRRHSTLNPEPYPKP
jgi:hypothetical protein